MTKPLRKKDQKPQTETGEGLFSRLLEKRAFVPSTDAESPLQALLEKKKEPEGEAGITYNITYTVSPGEIKVNFSPFPAFPYTSCPVCGRANCPLMEALSK